MIEQETNKPEQQDTKDMNSIEKIEAGKAFKKTIKFNGEEFTPHRLSIGEKREMAVLKADRSGEKKLTDYEENLVYATCWLDIALRDTRTGKWNAPDWWTGAENCYDEQYIIRLHNACWEATEKPFFRIAGTTGNTETPGEKTAD